MVRTATQLFSLLVVLAPTVEVAYADDLPWQTERRIIGVSELEPIENALGSPFYTGSQIVARLETNDGVGYCTGVRVGPDLFLTNYHCSDYKACDSIQFHLAFEKAIAPEQQLVLKCKEMLSKSVAYDYALYRVESVGFSPKPGDEGNPQATKESVAPPLSSFPTAILWAGPMQLGAPMYLAGHPGARFKEIDRGVKCALRSVEPELIEERKTITHTCDTEGGSSGSPLIDKNSGYVVALHWGGKDDFNMAIPISEIVSDLQKTLPADIYTQLHIVDH
ncbi:MAG: serine protease [Proteobacteria bacterium]|nr:serine protease [Pseudomonadota bacterium]